MSFALTRETFKTLRFRHMLLNAVVVLLAGMGTLVGLRAGMGFALVHELDQILAEDVQEVEFALVDVGNPASEDLHEELDRKARGHIQHSWFVQLYPADGFIAPTLVANSADSIAAEADENLEPDTELMTAEAYPDIPALWASVNVPDSIEHAVLPPQTPTSYNGYRVIERVIVDGVPTPIRIRVGASLTLINRDLAIIDRIIGIAFLIGLVVAPLGGYWLAGKVTRPLAEIIHTTERLRPSKLNERLPIRGSGDELDQLSKAFNLLLDRIASYLEQKQDFLANAAHELRTPLAALRSTAEVALQSERSHGEYQDLLGAIIEESESLEILVNQLLLLSETEADRLKIHGERVPLHDVVSKAVEMFRGVAENAEVNLELGDLTPIEVEGNRHHLRQVLNNFLDNAIKFTPPGGRVIVDLESFPRDRIVELRVTDTGPGIAPEEQPLVFERFYRGDRSRRRDAPTRGTGLGLSICQAVARAHGGNVEVKSQLGRGSSFSMQLPMLGAKPIVDDEIED